ncbi:hypothetical protein EYC84_008617 [Monilinia fructicola]|uniref:Uncharacterized protein n=1 Tax=Monilinia fructicola TaxID=38448 RepID=A0A5M9JMG8_MONFR|nr:hypothetical protein EYC84_008617 [Monilinia fructicola]
MAIMNHPGIGAPSIHQSLQCDIKQTSAMLSVLKRLIPKEEKREKKKNPGIHPSSKRIVCLTPTPNHQPPIHPIQIEFHQKENLGHINNSGRINDNLVTPFRLYVSLPFLVQSNIKKKT